MQIPHVPVLYREVVEAFEPCLEVVDCTMGYGGHSSLLLEASPNRRVIGIDQDPMAIAFSRERLAPYGDRMKIVQGRFSQQIGPLLQEDVCGVLADIGVSSLQLDMRERGFSYESDHLDMRMNPQSSLSAADVVNTYSSEALERILREYGEIPNAATLAHKIVSLRPFDSAKALVNALKPWLTKGRKMHPATLLMQAIRIEVNDELGELERLLDAIEHASISHMRVGIITFHSLEDRIVKNRFSRWAKSCRCPAEAFRCTCGNNHAIGRIITKKPRIAQADELQSNSRSRSAKFRVFEIHR